MSLLEQDVNRETANGWTSFTFYKLLRFICMHRFAFKKKSYQGFLTRKILKIISLKYLIGSFS